jgi:two-component system LytT family sensor kinase
MKKYFLFIAGLIILLFNSRGIAQYTTPTAAEMKRFMHNMSADSTDRWSYSGELYSGGKHVPKFNVWVRSRSIDNIHYFLSFILKGSILSAQLYNAAELELATTSITPDNANKYQYRVVTNDGLELVPWTTPSVFRSNKFTSYTYLGKFNCRHKTITLIIAEKNNKSNGSVFVYNSDDIPPVKISSMFVQYPTGLSAKSASDWNKGFGILSVKNAESINLNIENTSQNELYHVYLKRESDGKDPIPIGNNWEHNFNSPYPEMYISSSFFNKPGKYTIIIRPEITAGYKRPIIIGAEVRAHFTVLPGPITLSLKTVESIILIILTTGGFMFMMYRRQQKQKLAHEARNKQIATLQLQGVLAQLNPHFIFNALAGVQNLMNKKEVENANKYLARFARLTRNILDDSQKELTTIEHEAAMLNDYLQMEQMRFGFKFSLAIDEKEIDQQIEIPAMLLQPFIENAVKHGVSALKNEGMITVSIIKKGDDIVLAVQDNGKGFSSRQPDGMGIKLCEERIKLLNSIYKNTGILLHINSDSKGTLIIIELKNWL